ncbi:MAG: ATP-binding protein [Candidatus Electryonea clarkiae]|nr:ATP-binding protein [Candidatus Electryonea clarkiae]MDP8285946.1 ATP-binding protein [Candidatus Electryonea clarkiae]
MIKEIYIDNYKCLTNFRIQPGEFQLWLGDNGSGKSTVFAALRSIQLLLQHNHVDNIFKVSNLTEWDRREKQTIRVSMLLDKDTYDYNLNIEYSRSENKIRIGREELKWNDSTFFLFDGKNAHLYRINRDTDELEEGASFGADWSRSVIPAIAESEGNWPLLRFREAVFKWLLVNPIPYVVSNLAESDTRRLSEHAENFAEWYRNIIQGHPRISYRTKEHLDDVLPGFEQLSLMKEDGQSRRLTATFRINGKDRDFGFLALSDGQRQLVMLYTFMEALRSGVFSTIFIDEPDNFVSLREIKPWINNLKEICEEENRQVIIISHHPEIINDMAWGKELWFSRPEGAHVITKPMPIQTDLSPAEIVARGWENE